MAYLKDYKADNKCKNKDIQLKKYRLTTPHTYSM